jgi:hypothetical protein
MNESALERIRRETREKEVEKTVKAFRREQIEKKKTKNVRLIGMIYVEPLVSCTFIVEETKDFE